MAIGSQRGIVAAFVSLVSLTCPVAGQTQPTQQRGIDAILSTMRSPSIALLRANCALGDTTVVRATRSSYSLDVAQFCVTVLTRAGRDGSLTYARDARGDQATPSLVFDSGFVGGYLAREAVPTGAPSMATLLEVAQRCLDRSQSEANSKLCGAAGHLLGTRAAQGEPAVPRS